MYVFPFKFTILVDDVVKWIDVHIGTKSEEYIPDHFVNFDSPLKRSKTVCIDGIYDVEMQKIKFLFRLVKWRFYECGIWELKMRVECGVKWNIQFKCLADY